MPFPALADFLDGLEITHFNSQTHLLFKLYLCKDGAAKTVFQPLAMRVGESKCASPVSFAPLLAGNP
jgi:hypothetical protein